jgi:hypothetical protein
MRVDTVRKYVLTLILLFNPLAVYDVTTARLLLFSAAALFEIGPGWLTQSEQFHLDQTEGAPFIPGWNLFDDTFGLGSRSHTVKLKLDFASHQDGFHLIQHLTGNSLPCLSLA